MRINVEFESKGEIKLPIHYNYFIQSMIYKTIEDKVFTTFLHDKGYEINLKSFKLFSFSRLEGKYEIVNIDSQKYIIFDKKVSLIVSSPIDDFIEKFSTGLLKAEKIHLKDNELNLVSADIHKRQFSKYDYKIKMLSPICAYKTIKIQKKDDRHYYTPYDDEFYQLISQNLIDKCNLLIKDFDKSRFNFNIQPLKVNQIHNFKPMMFKNTIIKGWTGIYEVKSSPEIMEVAYYCGIGSKNSQGFGLFEIIE